MKKGTKVSLIVAGCILALVLATVIVLNAVLPADGKIATGVKIAGQDVGGMTIEEIETALTDNDYYNGKNIVFVGEPDTEEISGEHIGLAVDAKASGEMAYKLCRDGNWLENAVSALKLRFSGADLAPVATANETLDEIIYQRGVRKNGEMREVAVEEISETEVRVLPVIAGQSRDVSESRKEVLEEIEKGNTDAINLELPISGKDAITAEKLYNMIYIEPVSAEYTVENNKMHITPEVVGRSADMTEIEDKIEALTEGAEIVLAITKTFPEVTAESLTKELFSSELASYSSTYSTSAVNRSFNVSRAANSVNGTILMPGEVFSYNETIGNPSLANGYKIASVYENGRQTEGVGGGVCQVSSTLYSAALYANLEIVERRSHSLTVAYVPKGQDATVSYGVLDFKFRNSTENPIKIEASAVGGVCRVKILGTKPQVEQKVQIVNTTVSTISPTTTETPDSTLPEGTRKTVTSGKSGYVVDSVRIVTENGKEVKREQLTRSSYKAVAKEVLVGTKAVTTPAPLDTPASTPVVTEPAETPQPVEETPMPSAPAETPELIVVPTEEPAEPVSTPIEEPKEEV